MQTLELQKITLYTPGQNFSGLVRIPGRDKPWVVFWKGNIWSYHQHKGAAEDVYIAAAK